MNNKFVWAVIVVLVVIGFYLYGKPVNPIVLDESTSTVTTKTSTTTVESTPESVSATTTTTTVVE